MQKDHNISKNQFYNKSEGVNHCIQNVMCIYKPFLNIQVIFRFALALFKYKEEEILKLQDSMSIFKYLRYFTRTILDAR